MPCKSKILNSNNFLRWMKLTDTTLANLQADGIPSSLCEDSICGLSISVVVTETGQTIKAIFNQGNFDTELKIEDNAGNPLSGYNWIISKLANVNLDPGTYTAKFRKVGAEACIAQKDFTVTEICDIRVEVFQNQSSVIIQHSYGGINHPTEYRLDRQRRPGEPPSTNTLIPGYDWIEATELDIDSLPDDRYQVKVRKKSRPSCIAIKNFVVEAAFARITDFVELNGDTIPMTEKTPYWHIENKSTTSIKKIQINVNNGILSTNLETSLTSFKSGKNTVITLNPGQICDVRLSVNNTFLTTQRPIVTIKDITGLNDNLEVVSFGRVTYPEEVSIQIEFSRLTNPI